MVYYNEIDPDAAAWLRELIKQGLIADGVVDTRSITEIKAHELSHYTQCHFFAGIGGWSYALRLAGWPDDKPVWTGSCPCQPFSSAGKGLGTADERHLWPVFFDLIRECRPDTVFGEQVESAIRHGWLDGIRADLEGEGYALGDCTLGAHSVSAPHIRQRLFWVADSVGKQTVPTNAGGFHSESGSGCAASGLADTVQPGRAERGTCSGGGPVAGSGATHRLGDDDDEGPQGHDRDVDDGGEPRRDDEVAAGPVGEAGGVADRVGVADITGFIPRGETTPTTGYGDTSDTADFWADSVPILCRDGKYRRIPTEPALFPLSDGLPYKLARRGSIRPALLKGAGNAIVPQVAAEFIRAFSEIRG